MKKGHIILFSLRLFFYFSVITLILIHPGIAVSFDRIGFVQWFIIIPVLAVIAFLPFRNSAQPAQKLRNKFIYAAMFLLAFSIMAGGVSVNAFQPFAAGLLSFILTFLLFHYPGWAKLSVLEPFFLAWIALRLLALSRSGEDVAGQAAVLTQFILVWTAAVFIFHGVVVYLCLFPQSYVKAWKEGLAFVFAAAALLVIMLAALPVDFVRNTVIENLTPERLPERIKSDSDRGLPRRGGRRTLPRGEGGDGPELRGLSEHDWPGRGGGSDENRQYLVMVAVSDREPVYMGNSFRGQLDPVNGFLPSPEEPLNGIVNQRFFVTWFNNENEFDLNREKQEVILHSTLRQKFLPWRPVSADPTILNETSGPLRYIHRIVSNTHNGDPLELVNAPSRPLSDFEKHALAPYLDISLDDEDADKFSLYFKEAVSDWNKNREKIISGDRYLKNIFGDGQEERNEHLEIIIALLTSFSKYRYNLNSDDDSSVAALKQFLFSSAEGDCVEFSNTLALLGRFAGIPSRVVTGYLAADSLQTMAHLRGLAMLQRQIPALQQFPFEHLYMVTNIHAHSWTQFYIPDYGWLDFESTAFSIPPVGMGDFNNWDVVIPLVDGERTFSQVRRFPWRAVLRTVIALLIFAVLSAYALRFGREIILYLGVKQGGRKGARCLYLLLLARLAADGQPIKPASKTAHEYSQLFPAAGENPHFKTFADLYSRLRWYTFPSEAEQNECFSQLTKEYRSILTTTRRRGVHRCLIRLFSLRGLAYL